jgi:hypothetical protein
MVAARLCGPDDEPEHVVLDDEVAKFEQRLVEEWQLRFEAMCEGYVGTPEDDTALKQEGHALYRWVENEARFPFRSLTARPPERWLLPHGLDTATR